MLKSVFELQIAPFVMEGGGGKGMSKESRIRFFTPCDAIVIVDYGILLYQPGILPMCTSCIERIGGLECTSSFYFHRTLPRAVPYPTS